MRLQIANTKVQRIASGEPNMDKDTVLDKDQAVAIKRSLALQKLQIKDGQGAIICQDCLKVIKLSFFTDGIIWAQCDNCAPNKFIRRDEFDKIVAEYDHRFMAVERAA